MPESSQRRRSLSFIRARSDPVYRGAQGNGSAQNYRVPGTSLWRAGTMGRNFVVPWSTHSCGIDGVPLCLPSPSVMSKRAAGSNASAKSSRADATYCVKLGSDPASRRSRRKSVSSARGFSSGLEARTKDNHPGIDGTRSCAYRKNDQVSSICRYISQDSIGNIISRPVPSRVWGLLWGV